MEKITKDQLEKMVQAFGEGWKAADAEKDGFSLPGDRRRYGLTVALNVIGIEVDTTWRKD